MKNKGIITTLLACLLLCAVTFLCMQSNKENNEAVKSNATVDEKNSLILQDKEIKGVWVSYISLSMESSDNSQEAFESKFSKIISDCKYGGFNTLIVQVRPFGDALYESDIFPSSHIISGEQGKEIGYDPLEIMVEMCHQNKLDIHAWINPYRIKTDKTLKTLSKDNPYTKDNSLGVKWDNGIYYNPANTKARELIVEGVKEIVENYEVDGIQFDDYFYPTQDEDFDKSDYQSYVKNLKDSSKALSLDDWRKQNVNLLISDVYKAVHKTNDNVVFGISPQGNLNNNEKLYADVKTWVTIEGYIDYICPQIYFSLDNPALTFEESLTQWLELKGHKNLKMYIGLAGYKGGTDADEGTWLDNDDILLQEIEIIREENLDGFMLYSYESLVNDENKEEIENVINYLN